MIGLPPETELLLAALLLLPLLATLLWITDRWGKKAYFSYFGFVRETEPED